MTADQVKIIGTTWQSVSARRQSFARVFYEELFNQSPSLRKLFGDDMSDQERKLTAALDAIVKDLTAGRDIAADLRALGKRHVGYGVTAIDYIVVGEAFVATLQQILGAAFSAEAQSAWTSAYGLIAAEMKGGAPNSC
jgi:hemoglobin-like flavoprotein